MSNYWCGGFKDDELIERLGAAAVRDRATTAELLAMIGEVEERRLYADHACHSMHRYCVRVLRMSEDVAIKRLRVARAARRHPQILDGIADGQLTVTGVKLLLPHMVEDNAARLLEAARGRTNKQIDRLIAEWFPKPDAPTVIWRVESVAAPAAEHAVAVASTGVTSDSSASSLLLGVESGPEVVAGTANSTEPLAARPVVPSNPAKPAQSMGPLSELARVAPLSVERYVIQVTVSQATHDKLREAQDLLGHAVPSGDVAELLDRALDALIEKHNKRKYAATTKPPAKGDDPSDPNLRPAAVRRVVRARDEGQCTYRDGAGVRCEARGKLEFHHRKTKACGGGYTVENLSLRCRTHNRRQADKDFGPEFMNGKVEAARAKRNARAKAQRPLPEGEPATAVAAREARARGLAPADVLQSREPATEAMAELDRLLERAG